MPPQREFPQSLLETAIETMFPQTRKDMDANEIYAYIMANAEVLRSKLQQFGANPAHYEDVPVIADLENPEADTRLGAVSVAAITAVREVGRVEAGTPGVAERRRSR